MQKTPMTVTPVSNGFVLEINGVSYVAKTLDDVAALMGISQEKRTFEFAQSRDCAVEKLQRVRSLANSTGGKIGAIKLFRDIFDNQIGLFEAKTIIEELCC